MDAEQVILSRQLPKTGQSISYSAGDDGFIEAGWWKGRLNINNKTRFIAKTIAGDDIVIDRATGLMWVADGNAAGCNGGVAEDWVRILSVAIALNFAGFTDWRMPNIKELMSIVDYGEKAPAINTTFFPNTLSENYWSSTARIYPTPFVWAVKFDEGGVTFLDKIQLCYLRCVRGGV